MSNKRAREEEDPPLIPPAAESTGDNAFVSWLISKIYTYAEVRDNEELRKTREDLRIRKEAYENLLRNVRNGTIGRGGLCNRCGNVGPLLNTRQTCGACEHVYVPCLQLPWCKKSVCGSGKHALCHTCSSFLHYSEKCTGTDESVCTFKEEEF